MKNLETFDQKILISVQSWRNPFFNKLFLFLTYTGTGKAWFIFAITLNALHSFGISFTNNQLGFLRGMISPFLAWALGTILKKLISRERPSEKINGYKQLIMTPDCSSFPSSHTAAAISFFVVLLLLNHPFALAIGAWAILVSFSRLYLGVHYLSDIMGGTFLGCVCSFVVYHAFIG